MFNPIAGQGPSKFQRKNKYQSVIALHNVHNSQIPNTEAGVSLG